MFIHTVYFWMAEDAPADAADRIIADCREILAKIESVRQLWAGKPAMTPRDVVDNSYGVGLTVVFDDAAGHDIYNPHPLHNEFIARNKASWSRVQVYDFAE